jgi:hypothetical protein
MTPAMPRPVVEGGHGRHAFGPSSSSSVSTMQIAAPTAIAVIAPYGWAPTPSASSSATPAQTFADGAGRAFLRAPLRLGSEPPRASARVCNRRRLRAGCWRSGLLRPAGIPARKTDHTG